MARKSILICSILRNQVANYDIWLRQLSNLYLQVKSEYDVYFSFFENDSVDQTPLCLANQNYFDYFRLDNNRIIATSHKFGTKQYGSIWDVDRLKNLAFYRNSCVKQGLERWKDVKFDKIAFIEPDVTYDPNWCKELILARHPAQAGIEPHIYSGWSLRSMDNPKTSMLKFDTCADRMYQSDICWNFENEHQWTNKSLIRTNLGGNDGDCLHSIYTTFSCFCVYAAQPFYEGVEFGFINKFNNPSNIGLQGGWLEADTVNICLKFREKRYNNILTNKNCLIRHN